MTELSISHYDSLRHAVRGDVVAADVWLRIEQMAEASVEAAEILRRAEQEAATIAEKAERIGLEQGKQQAMQESTELLLLQRRQGDQLLQEMEGRVAELALGITRRLMAEVEVSQLLPGLVAEAIQSIQAKRYLKISVHPQSAEAVQERLDEIRRSQPMLDSLEVQADESISPDACLLQSEAGMVRASLSAQLAAIEKVVIST